MGRVSVPISLGQIHCARCHDRHAEENVTGTSVAFLTLMTMVPTIVSNGYQQQMEGPDISNAMTASPRSGSSCTCSSRVDGGKAQSVTS